MTCAMCSGCDPDATASGGAQGDNLSGGAEAAVGLGSNLGDRFAFLSLAREALANLSETELLASSPIYETEPVGGREEDRNKLFLNAVVILATGLDAPDLARRLHGIENSLDRQRTGNRYAPRTIDLDLLYYDGLRREDPALWLPHPQIRARRFVCQPLADLRPGLRLPGEPASITRWLADLPESPRVRRTKRQWPRRTGRS